MLEVLPRDRHIRLPQSECHVYSTYAKTLEKSLEGDTTKLSLVGDHAMRLRILWSSNILLHRSDLLYPFL